MRHFCTRAEASAVLLSTMWFMEILFEIFCGQKRKPFSALGQGSLHLWSHTTMLCNLWTPRSYVSGTKKTRSIIQSTGMRSEGGSQKKPGYQNQLGHSTSWLLMQSFVCMCSAIAVLWPHQMAEPGGPAWSWTMSQSKPLRCCYRDETLTNADCKQQQRSQCVTSNLDF